jgi:hypothetical protein
VIADSGHFSDRQFDSGKRTNCDTRQRKGGRQLAFVMPGALQK